LRDLEAIDSIDLRMPDLDIYRALTLSALKRSSEAGKAASAYLRGSDDLTNRRSKRAVAIVWEAWQRDRTSAPQTLRSLEAYLGFVVRDKNHSSQHDWWLRVAHLRLLASNRAGAIEALERMIEEHARARTPENAERARGLKNRLSSSDERVAKQAAKRIADQVERPDGPPR
jgi:hypothetical protein